MSAHLPPDILLVTEIFHSIQGETSQSGLPFIFVRLTGCNLRCTYCDSSYAFHGGTRMRISEIIEKIKTYQTKNVLITGGEPMMQRNTSALIDELNDLNYKVSIETHGEASIEPVAQKARIVMDIKTPSSGMCRGEFKNNLKYLKPSDEIKFVIASKDDYEWAKQNLSDSIFPTREVLFSPANRAKDMPGAFEGVTPTWLAEKILEDQLPVRLQLQLHKVIWGSDAHGV
jgi:7-carboxy-7-deazaguanine synthase